MDADITANDDRIQETIMAAGPAGIKKGVESEIFPPRQ